jgi:hypothetical protein
MVNNVDLEIEPLRPGISYKKIQAYDHGENTIYEFEKVRCATTTDETKIRKLIGTYLPVVPAPHHFHFLKEYLGSFLYYRDHINREAKILWIDIQGWNGDEWHNNHEGIQKTLELLSEAGIPIVFVNEQDFLKTNLEFEKVAVIYDTSAFFVSKQFPHFDQFKHTNNEQVREFFKRYMSKDPSYPKKVYVSRRNVSEFLDKNEMKTHISRYNEKHVEDALEDFFVKRGYQVINFSGMTLQQQIMYMYNATHVAGLMGAGTWNGIFCDNGVKYFCLQTHMWFLHEYNKDIEKVIDLDYRLIKVHKTESYESVTEELLNQISDA